jgi:hypothetical protein
LFDLCQWIQNTDFSVYLRESTLAFPCIEGTHLLAIGVSAGTIAFTDLRLLGLLMKKEPASKVMSSLLMFTVAGFILVFITGALLFWAEAAKSYGNLWFRIKLLFLILAGINALVFPPCLPPHEGLGFGAGGAPGSEGGGTGFTSIVDWSNLARPAVRLQRVNHGTTISAAFLCVVR